MTDDIWHCEYQKHFNDFFFLLFFQCLFEMHMRSKNLLFLSLRADEQESGFYFMYQKLNRLFRKHIDLNPSTRQPETKCRVMYIKMPLAFAKNNDIVCISIIFLLVLLSDKIQRKNNEKRINCFSSLQLIQNKKKL